MKNRSPVLSIENFLYLVFLSLALALRLYHLGASPLAEAEAREALVAFQWVRGLPALGLPHSPGYFFFTSLFFFIFGAGDTIARLAPALAGASLALLPALFRDKLGRPQALLTSGLLTISAGMLAASRTADGTLLALAGLGWGVGLFRRYLHDKALPTLLLSAGLLSLGLASGAPFITGSVVCLLATSIVAWLNPEEREGLRSAWAAVRVQGVVFLVALGVATLLTAAVGLAYLPGLGALTGSWQDWAAGFLPSPAGRAPGLFPLFLVAYEPLILVFGAAGSVLAFRRNSGQPLAEADTAGETQTPAQSAASVKQWLFWSALIAFVFGLVYGGRTLSMLAWVAVPLAGLAACALVEIIGALWAPAEWPNLAVQVAIVLTLLVFAAIRLTNFVFESYSGAASANANIFLALIAFLMAVGISLLFGAGWSWKSATVGATLSAVLVLAAVSFFSGWGLTQTQAASPAELWWQTPTAEAVDRLVQTARHVSNFSVGSDYDVPLTVQSDTAAAPGWVLRWVFRDFTHATFVAELDPLVNTTVVVAPAAVESPALGSAYKGQAFAFRRSWTSSLGGVDWVAWALYRQAPAQTIQTDKLILWVRQDAAASVK